MFGLVPRRKENREGAMVSRVNDPFELIHREMDTMFDRFLGGWPFAFTRPFEGERFWGLDLTEGEKEVVVRAELPGFEPGEIELSLQGNTLNIAAEHKVEEGKETEKTQSFASVRRSLTLPEGLEAEKIEATYRNGVLEVHVPRKPEVLPRKIEVKG